MRPVSIFTLAAALGSIALLTACTGNSPGSPSLVPNASSPLETALRARGHGIRPLGTCGAERRQQARMAHGQSAQPAKAVPYLYVADDCEPSIDVFNSKTYYELGSISGGVEQPNDVFVDRKGNLYEADNGGYVNEYAPGSWTAPSFTYNANEETPYAVTVDTHGNVYEGDGNGYINEYFQEQNSETISSCKPVSGSIFGVAVDSQNDVFATVFVSSTEEEELIGYGGGLNNCPSPTVLLLPSANIGSGDIALDKNANLLIANGGDLEVVDRSSGYDTVNASLGGFECAEDVRLNKANTLAYVADYCAGTVTVVNYPSLTIAGVLGTGNGLSKPVAAVAAPNAVY